MDRQKRRVIILIISVGIFIISSMAQAEDEKRIAVVRAVSNEVEGEVSAVSKDYIAVVYSQDAQKGIEYEISFPIDGSITLEHLKSASHISVGDRVRITFEEQLVKDEEKQITRRKPKKISFVRPAVKKPEINEEVVEEEEESEELPIKGLKSE